ncbi:hypothetical protein [Micromonospora sp. CPCC 206061]|uniref:hypothetical protein n=1 Tax=Micromonospora sp. CPCC 206061 TaxID=3122410 RepID=UPI002FF09E43
MNTTERVNRAMWDATDRLRLAPDFADRVVRGGRRRVRRARVQGVALAVAVAMAGGGATVAWRDATAGPAVVADYRLLQPTGGDLAGDARVIEQVVRAWRDGLRHSESGDGAVAALRGEPHVYWAGTTKGGPAAVVVQAGARRDRVAMAGLVATDPVSKEFRLVGEESVAHGVSWVYAFGPEDRTLLAVDPGVPLYISMAPVTGPDGKVSRDWRRMSTMDGVALAEVPAGGDPRDVRVLARQAPPAARERDPAGLHPVREASQYVEQAVARGGPVPAYLPINPTRADSAGLSWENRSVDGPTRVGRPTQVTDDGGILLRAVGESGYVDPLIEIHGSGRWEVVAGLPDGRTALLSEIFGASDPALVFAVLLDATGAVDAVIPGGAADRDAPVPVRVRLPDGQGWIVAAYGSSLAYRTAGGAWVEVGQDAALLPDTAAEVRAVTAGGVSSSQPL